MNFLAMCLQTFSPTTNIDFAAISNLLFSPSFYPVCISSFASFDAIGVLPDANASRIVMDPRTSNNISSVSSISETTPSPGVTPEMTIRRSRSQTHSQRGCQNRNAFHTRYHHCHRDRQQQVQHEHTACPARHAVLSLRPEHLNGFSSPERRKNTDTQ